MHTLKRGMVYFYGVYDDTDSDVRVFSSWAEASRACTGVSGRRVKKFRNFADAASYSRVGCVLKVATITIDAPTVVDPVTQTRETTVSITLGSGHLTTLSTTCDTTVAGVLVRALTNGLDALFQSKSRWSKVRILLPGAHTWPSIQHAMRSGQSVETRRLYSILLLQLDRVGVVDYNGK